MTHRRFATTTFSWMKRNLGLLGLSLISVASMQADNFAYLTTYTDQFGTIDLDTGAYTQITVFPFQAVGLVVSSGYLYTAQVGGSILYRVNPVNGALTTVGTGTVGYSSLGSTPTGIYAMDSAFNLYSVSTRTGAQRLIGATHIPVSDQQGVVGMSNNSTTLYVAGGGAVSGALFYTINTCNGAATAVANTAFGFPTMLFEGGLLYEGETSVYTINPTTGAATFVANTSGNPPPGIFYGLAPSVLLSISVTGLTFPTQTVGTTSSTETVTLTNHGFTAMAIGSLRVTGDFAETNSCGSSLAANASCEISVVFSPTQTLTRAGELILTDSAGGSPQIIYVSGVGQ